MILSMQFPFRLGKSNPVKIRGCRGYLPARPQFAQMFFWLIITPGLNFNFEKKFLRVLFMLVRLVGKITIGIKE